MKGLIAVFVLVLSIGCKNNVEEASIKIEEPTKKQLIIRFNFKTNKSDVFKIMLNNIKVDELQSKSIHVFENVVPSTGEDAIVAEFDAGNISNNIIIHLGSSEVKEVEIKGILISYGNNQYNITSPDDLNKYIEFNEFIERNLTSNTLNTIRVDGKLNPILKIKHNLINLLKKE